MNYNELLQSMVWVTLNTPDDFLKVKETLTRIGLSSTKTKTLYQSCHILHKQGNYAIVHFKELFALDGRSTNISDEDIARRNKIANLLAEWNLVRLIDPDKTKTPQASISQLKIVPFKEKGDWDLVAKYNIGGKK